MRHDSLRIVQQLHARVVERTEARPPEVAARRLGEREVLFELEPARAEVRRELGRVEPERERLAELLHVRDRLGTAREERLAVDHRAVDVGEQERLARARGEAQRGVDGGLVEIVRDALPEQQRARISAQPRARESVGQRVAPEHHGHVGHVRGRRPDHAPLHRLRGGMVDLEHAHALDPGQAVGTRVEAGAEQHELVEPARERGGDRVVDPARAHGHRRARTRPARIDRARERRRGEQRGKAIAPAQEAARKRVGKQRLGQALLDRAEQRVVLGGAAGAIGAHGGS